MANEQDPRLSTADLAGVRSEPQTGGAVLPAGDEARARSSAGSTPAQHTPLLPPERITSLRERWQTVQGKFVDQPRDAVQEADALIAEVIRELAEDFAHARTELERQWDQDSDVDTEDLRVALQHYRSFMERLLAA